MKMSTDENKQVNRILKVKFSFTIQKKTKLEKNNRSRRIPEQHYEPWGTQQTEHKHVKAKSQVQIDKLNLLIKNDQIRGQIMWYNIQDILKFSSFLLEKG